MTAKNREMKITVTLSTKTNLEGVGKWIKGKSLYGLKNIHFCKLNSSQLLTI